MAEDKKIDETKIEPTLDSDVVEDIDQGEANDNADLIHRYTSHINALGNALHGDKYNESLQKVTDSDPKARQAMMIALSMNHVPDKEKATALMNIANDKDNAKLGNDDELMQHIYNVAYGSPISSEKVETSETSPVVEKTEEKEPKKVVIVKAPVDETTGDKKIKSMTYNDRVNKFINGRK